MEPRDLLLRDIDDRLKTRYNQQLAGLKEKLNELNSKFRFQDVEEICFRGLDVEEILIAEQAMASLRKASKDVDRVDQAHPQGMAVGVEGRWDESHWRTGNLLRSTAFEHDRFRWISRVANIAIDELAKIATEHHKKHKKNFEERFFLVYAYLAQFFKRKCLAATAGILIYTGACQASELRLPEEFEACGDKFSDDEKKGFNALRQRILRLKGKYRDRNKTDPDVYEVDPWDDFGLIFVPQNHAWTICDALNQLDDL